MREDITKALKDLTASIAPNLQRQKELQTQIAEEAEKLKTAAKEKSKGKA